MEIRPIFLHVSRTDDHLLEINFDRSIFIMKSYGNSTMPSGSYLINYVENRIMNIE